MRNFVVSIFMTLFVAMIALGCGSSKHSSSSGATNNVGGTGPAPLVFATTPALSRAYTNQAVDTFIIVGGGKTPFTFKTTGGSLPAGVTGSPTIDGRFEISGTPTTTGNYSFSLQVTDATSKTAAQSFTLAVTDTIVIATPSTLPNATVGQSYTFQFTATGGTGTGYSDWHVSSGSFPPGLTLDANTGKVTGTPTGPTATTYGVSVTCTDSGKDGAVGFMGAAPPNSLSSVNISVQ